MCRKSEQRAELKRTTDWSFEAKGIESGKVEAGKGREIWKGDETEWKHEFCVTYHKRYPWLRRGLVGKKEGRKGEQGTQRTMRGGEREWSWSKDNGYITHQISNCE